MYNVAASELDGSVHDKLAAPLLKAIPVPTSVATKPVTANGTTC